MTFEKGWYFNCKNNFSHASWKEGLVHLWKSVGQQQPVQADRHGLKLFVIVQNFCMSNDHSTLWVGWFQAKSDSIDPLLWRLALYNASQRCINGLQNCSVFSWKCFLSLWRQISPSLQELSSRCICEYFKKEPSKIFLFSGHRQCYHDWESYIMFTIVWGKVGPILLQLSSISQFPMLFFRNHLCKLKKASYENS